MAQKPTLWRFSALGGRAGARGSPQRALVVLRQACRSHDLLNGDHEPIRIPACQHAADPCAGLFAEAAQADGLRHPWLRGRRMHGQGDLRQQRRPKGGSRRAQPPAGRGVGRLPPAFIMRGGILQPASALAKAMRTDRQRTAAGTRRRPSLAGASMRPTRLQTPPAASARTATADRTPVASVINMQPINNRHVRLRGDSPERHPLTPAARRMEIHPNP